MALLSEPMREAVYMSNDPSNGFLGATGEDVGGAMSEADTLESLLGFPLPPTLRFTLYPNEQRRRRPVRQGDGRETKDVRAAGEAKADDAPVSGLESTRILTENPDAGHAGQGE